MMVISARLLDSLRYNLKADMRLKKWLPTLDNLRNFLLTPTAEMLNFFQQMREAI